MPTAPRLCCSALALMAAFGPLISLAADRPDPKMRSVTLPDEIHWRKGTNADTAVIQGDPAKPGIYIQLIRWHPGGGTRPHYHPDVATFGCFRAHGGLALDRSTILLPAIP